LVLNPDVLFHRTNTQEEIDSARKYNAQFDGIGPSQLDGFAKLLATSKDKLEERFRNIEIRQDGPLGLVTFNYDFVINDKVHHSGLEVWQNDSADAGRFQRHSCRNLTKNDQGRRRTACERSIATLSVIWSAFRTAQPARLWDRI